MIEVFRTTVDDEKQVGFLLGCLDKELPGHKINFDLEDCDNVLRVENKSDTMDVKAIVDCLRSYGFVAEVLPDMPQILIGSEAYQANVTDASQT